MRFCSYSQNLCIINITQLKALDGKYMSIPVQDKKLQHFSYFCLAAWLVQTYVFPHVYVCIINTILLY